VEAPYLHADAHEGGVGLTKIRHERRRAERLPETLEARRQPA
jgi:hypothetical protein